VSHAQPIAAKGVVSRTIGGETVLVPVRTTVVDFKNLFLLNKVAAFVWKHLDGQRDRDALCALVREHFEVPAAVDVGADVDHFLGALVERGLVEKVG
jgi:Coenzyme PQQ synthesis protein D (PqqD)